MEVMNMLNGMQRQTVYKTSAWRNARSTAERMAQMAMYDYFLTEKEKLEIQEALEHEDLEMYQDVFIDGIDENGIRAVWLVSVLDAVDYVVCYI